MEMSCFLCEDTSKDDSKLPQFLKPVRYMGA